MPLCMTPRLNDMPRPLGDSSELTAALGVSWAHFVNTRLALQVHYLLPMPIAFALIIYLSFTHVYTVCFMDSQSFGSTEISPTDTV